MSFGFLGFKEGFLLYPKRPFRVWGLGLAGSQKLRPGSGFRVWGLGVRGFRVWGSGFGLLGLRGFRI